MKRHDRIGLDTSIFIYEVEENSKYIGLAHSVFGWLADGETYNQRIPSFAWSYPPDGTRRTT
ncbi:MAG: hypothetical protein LAP85_25940 [Acidobacteriia bacterium]|nr:hypothetical protein [Terriglobia bacterium]